MIQIVSKSEIPFLLRQGDLDLSFSSDYAALEKN